LINEITYIRRSEHPFDGHEEGQFMAFSQPSIKLYFTQRELAERFRVSQSTIINWRNRGLLRYLKLPGSSRVLYPVDAIEEFEQQQIVYEKEVMKNIRSRGKRSKISTITEWRIL
jgi:hypothetical protein